MIKMNISTLIGSLGVGLLLVAYFLNLFRRLASDNKIYILLNILGAGISCYASILLHYLPFIVLEAIWCGVGIAALFRRSKTA
jgi:predicted branched-subunit amino acid permease